jgi:two-component SAPR family response regulator
LKPSPQAQSEPPQSLAFYGTRQADLLRDFVRLAKLHLTVKTVVVVTAASTKPLPRGIAWHVITDEAAGFQRIPISFAKVEAELAAQLKSLITDPATAVVCVDMGWGLRTASATANFENWMPVASRLAAKFGVAVVSLYNRSLLIDEHLLAALRGHPAVLASEGVTPNPHWLPPELMTNGTLRQQVNYWLGSVAPSLIANDPYTDHHAAEGTNPTWLLNRRVSEQAIHAKGERERWKIRCFGRLRVYRADSTPVDWGTTGGATLKTKTLFAYLLQQGGKGALADDLADLLWPDAISTELAKNRLYHTVRCLRQALAGSDKALGESYVLRDGSNYVLVPPERSWLDISSFEQLCRQSQSHQKAGDLDEALVCLQAADRLYSGDLFEDIPPEYVDDQERDWCWTKRYWLRDMYLKVQRDAARIYRGRKEYSAALSHCQKALALDPLSEFAHEESMLVFAAQNRPDTIERQFALYQDSLAHFDDHPRSENLIKLYHSLRAK